MPKTATPPPIATGKIQSLFSVGCVSIGVSLETGGSFCSGGLDGEVNSGEYVNTGGID